MSTKVCGISVKCSHDNISHVSKPVHCGRRPLILKYPRTWVTLSNQSWDRGQVTFDKDRILLCVGRSVQCLCDTSQMKDN